MFVLSGNKFVVLVKPGSSDTEYASLPVAVFQSDSVVDTVADNCPTAFIPVPVGFT